MQDLFGHLEPLRLGRALLPWVPRFVSCSLPSVYDDRVLLIRQYQEIRLFFKSWLLHILCLLVGTEYNLILP